MGKLIIESGYPKDKANFIRQRLKMLNEKFGFYPDVELVAKDVLLGDKKGSQVAVNFADENKIRIGTKYATIKLHDGYAIDHEYGHFFDVRAEPDLKAAKNMVKLNPNNEYFKNKLLQKQKELDAYKNSPHLAKWQRLDAIFKGLKKEVSKGLHPYQFTNLGEFAAEVFAGHLYGAKHGSNQKLYDEAYNIIVSLPKKKVK